MSSILTREQVDKNCRALMAYPHCNLHVSEQDGQVLEGYSDYNVHYKAIRMGRDWWYGYNQGTRIHEYVIRTLNGIQNLLNTNQFKCPIHFFMTEIEQENGRSYGKAITYRDVCERIIRSNTLRNAPGVIAKAMEVKEIYDKHPMGIVDKNLTDRQRLLVKERLLKGIAIDLIGAYCRPEESERLLGSGQLNFLEPQLPGIQPPNAFDNIAGMEEYLLEKAKHVMYEVFDNQLWSHEHSRFISLPT